MQERSRDRARARPRAVLIAGPTASGKSALALALARAVPARIINADSMQVYGDLRTITARPTAAEEASVPHRLYGHIDAAARYSAGAWLRDVQRELSEAEAVGALPIVTGGTGLYFKLLTQGIAQVPAIDPEIRTRLRARLAEEGAPALHAELLRLDPAGAARVRENDYSRIVRALEVIEATGRPLAAWQEANAPAILDPAEVLTVFIAPDRDALRARIDERFDAMLAAGALEEVQRLGERGLDPALPAMKAHGVPWLLRHLRGEISLAEAAEGGKADTRRYSKRQFTWFRNQLAAWPWESAAAARERLLAALA